MPNRTQIGAPLVHGMDCIELTLAHART